MIIKIKANHRSDNIEYRYRDFEIIMAGENIIPPLPMGEKYACKVLDIQRISKNESVIKNSQSIFHEHKGSDVEETLKETVREAEEWIEKTYFDIYS